MSGKAPKTGCTTNGAACPKRNMRCMSTGHLYHGVETQQDCMIAVLYGCCGVGWVGVGGVGAVGMGGGVKSTCPTERCPCSDLYLSSTAVYLSMNTNASHIGNAKEREYVLSLVQPTAKAIKQGRPPAILVESIVTHLPNFVTGVISRPDNGLNKDSRV